MAEEKRHAVNLTEAEISALIIAVSGIRLIDVHPCRIKQTHAGLTELKERQREIEIERGE